MTQNLWALEQISCHGSSGSTSKTSNPTDCDMVDLAELVGCIGGGKFKIGWNAIHRGRS